MFREFLQQSLWMLDGPKQGIMLELSEKKSAIPLDFCI
jgi:hypothetical protein